ncbi:MAG: alpha-galactosidase [Eubacterium sp.]|nr:alpha-galactosidase [Eubacterium sp.]
MIIDGGKYFILNTEDTTYLMRVTPYGILEHLYYGKRIRVTDSLDGLVERQEFLLGNNNQYRSDVPAVTLNNLCMEVSSEGKGDNREAFVVIEYSDKSRTSDFVFEAYNIDNDKEDLITLPSSYGISGEANHLRLVLKERFHDVRLYLDYYVFEKENIISRTAKIVNYMDEPIIIKQLMSAQLDMTESGYVMTTFNGAWAREMSRKDFPLIAGRHINSSYTGTSSSKANPFFMLSTPYTTEHSGIAFGMNLIYSGNHAEIAEVNEFGKTRILWGINPRGFSWTLYPEEEFESPEAIMTFSDRGFNKLSQNMHSFIRNHIVRGKWANKERPILINSWEAAYFDINEKKLLKLAKTASEVGIELFVMDDGWFGERNDDNSSLGDWYPNKDKLPHGIKGLCDRINQMGMSFGIWVEPEMVNVNSKLYRKHPDWLIQIPGREHSEGRNQRILDLGRNEVQEYIIESMSKVFSSANIEYVKWDMNRTFTDVYSENIGTEGNQEEVGHRYIMGLYYCMKVLTKRFPDILFEGCSAGGNRFDLGVLSYFPQIWGSDDTDAMVRTEIQTGYSYGYPQCCWGSHVSGGTNHQTLRNTPLRSRYSVAAIGCLGYECNLPDLSKEELSQIKSQISEYKEYRQVFQFGQIYRGRTFTGTSGLPGIDHGLSMGGSSVSGSILTKNNNNVTEWTVVSPDKKKAVGMLIQKMVVPDMTYEYFRATGLSPDKYYHFYSKEVKVNIKEFGDLINVAAPVHIKPNSHMQEIISRLYKLEGEKEDIRMFGSAIMCAGVKLSPAFAGTGFNEKTRIFSDFAARLYYMEEEVIE